MKNITLQQEFFQDCLLIIIPLLVTSILFFLSGYFLGKSKKQKVEKEESSSEKELKSLKQKYNELYISYSGGKINFDQNNNAHLISDKEIINIENENNLQTTFNTETLKENTPNINLQKKENLNKFFGTQYTIDDLKLIEGIGPKIASILNEKGINNWDELAITSTENIKIWLFEIGGAAYKIHDPTTWPFQAKLAADGKFEELKKLQEDLKKGKI